MREVQVSSIPRPRSQDLDISLNAKKKNLLEIGCGGGASLAALCRTHSDYVIYCIERTARKFEQANKLLQERRPSNPVYLIRDDAFRWLAHVFPKGFFQEIHARMPNPYPKAAQSNKRFGLMPAFDLVKDCLAPGGRVLVTSDRMSYLEEVAERMKSWQMKVEIKQQKTPRSHFEINYTSQGMEIYELKAKF